MANEPKPLNREAWLNRMAEQLRPWFRKRGYPIHGRISVTMSTMRPKTLGFCQYGRHTQSGDDINQVFISAYDDAHKTAVDVADTLCHELLHAVLPPQAGHGKPFKDGMDGIGLTKGKAIHASAGPMLRKHLEDLVAGMPPLPRYGLVSPARGTVGEPTGGNKGPFRFQCAGCKTTVYLKYTSLARAGTPPCWNQSCVSLGVGMEEIVKIATL